MFADRFEAGKQLSALLQGYRGKANTIILAIPRGGLQVGHQLRKDLELPLDIILTKKIGAPGHAEFAIGAVGSGGIVVLDAANVRYAGASREYIEGEMASLKEAIAAKERRYRGGGEPLELTGKTAIITDDGAATGSTVIAAVKVARALGAKKVVVALPVVPPDTAQKLEDEADEAFFVATPSDFFAVGQYYDSFPQVSDEEAMSYLTS